MTKPLPYASNRSGMEPNRALLPKPSKFRMTAQGVKNRQARRSMILTQMGRERWNGDPSIQPPALVKPIASGPLGKCPDDEEIPWHRRTKANR